VDIGVVVGGVEELFVLDIGLGVDGVVLGRFTSS
jgi:hypothetical protein